MSSEFVALASGPLFAFRGTTDGRFIYVGMSGRSITKATQAPNRPYGLYTRLDSHAGGRRSGDQFCVYVAGRLVLPTLTADDKRNQEHRGAHRLRNSSE
jgi:hypothetical protein